ncbi:MULTISPECIES: hypothetical protein [unclassified Pseudomonas]|uniref:hypothetical protein n=1 Tax=unclassified Pseudomonas TaxID=196821 RepID=UPI000C86C9B2|nr:MULTISPECIES: hypothetical protein [unclassified Pseudomonas]PMV27255.1 hypothetical protein C1X17_00270 [Pseudomonas sp. FW305-3-2-15-C-TSA2]PMV32510.1 hypothetical protein C1X22_00270 [Pseudomonas sp. DP16D-L5]PMV42224.1 hypothetical protein C1X21_00270 [Pseudomonas sp. FW305-3-2-15-A-LB2]PMV49736.1 hypothetical protein C1X16_02130 [Pseudomonas sp. FW305-3-2-15-C-R2A1]PMV55148.1 hypothetical protein C1X18_00270 [Pseudomonas sp. FW305-3-2-15-C-LB1]
MEEAVTRIVERRFPELAGAYHLPRFARVLAVADPPLEAGLCDDFRPRYAVDLEVLGPDGEVNADLPHLLGVALPVPGGGAEMGFYGFPQEGTVVVVSFAYGLPNKPFILQILPHGLSLPRVPKGDQVWQHSEAVQQRADAEGNWLRVTDATITDRASERQVQALENAERYQVSIVEVDDHSTESVGGIKTVEALGALKLLSGGSASLAAVDDLHMATGRDLNLVVGQKHNATIAGDMQEKILGMRESVAAIKQHLVSPKTWLGSKDINVLQVLLDLFELVDQMNSSIASHKHGLTPPPDNANDFIEIQTMLKHKMTKLNEITINT